MKIAEDISLGECTDEDLHFIVNRDYYANSVCIKNKKAMSMKSNWYTKQFHSYQIQFDRCTNNDPNNQFVECASTQEMKKFFN